MSKEWKGNRNSVSANNGMSTVWHPEQRAAGDFYTTDPEAVRRLVEYYSVAWGRHKDFSFWEPACGTGNISKVLEEYGNGHPVISTDLYDRGYGTPGVDFLKAELPKGVRVIITNPPYSLADKFVEHAMEILPWDGIYLALQNINYLAGKGRFSSIYNKGFLKQVHIYSGRINCYKNGIDTGHSSPVNYAWFLYTNDKTDYCKADDFDWQKWEKDVEEYPYKAHLFPHTGTAFMMEPTITWL